MARVCCFAGHDRYDNATSFLEESMVWWATRNGSSNSMDRRTIWSDAFGALHMSMGSPCLEWDDGGPCTEDTCSCRTECVAYSMDVLVFNIKFDSCSILLDAKSRRKASRFLWFGGDGIR